MHICPACWARPERIFCIGYGVRILRRVQAGELFDYIVEKGRLLEDEARQFFQQIVSGVEYCHRNMVSASPLTPIRMVIKITA